MILNKLLSINNHVIVRSPLQLLFRSKETRVLEQFRNFQRNCQFCERLWPYARKGYRSRLIETSQTRIFLSPQSANFNRVKNATYCVAKSNEEDSAKPKDKNENIFTVPNALCVLRIGMAPLIADTILHGQFGSAIGLLAIAGVTDLLDGWIARVVPGQSSVMGSFLDPMADKILVATLFLSLTYIQLIPVPLTVLIVGRDAILIAAGFFIRYQSLDPPRTLSRYFNVALPTAQLAPLFISKVNTGLQLTLVGATLASTIITSVDLHPYLQMLWYTTGATTIASAIWYCFAKDTVKMLRQTSAKIKSRANQKKKS